MHTLTCLAVTTVILAAPVSSSLARVNVYRCELDDGQISYQQIPCHGGSEPMRTLRVVASRLAAQKRRLERTSPVGTNAHNSKPSVRNCVAAIH